MLSGEESHTDLIENRFIDAWGNTKWFSGRIAKLNINNQIVLQTVTRDITERKSIEQELENYRNHLEKIVKERTEELDNTVEELRVANEQLISQKEELQSAIQTLNRAQDQLIQSEKMASLGVLSAGIAHEINNPLNFIHGGITGIENYINADIPEHKDALIPLINAINIGVKRASDIVTSLTHYSRHDDRPRTKCDMHAIIENCLIMLQSQLRNKIDIRKKFTSKPYILLGNEGKLHQAILNLIVNAEHSIDGKGTINIETEVTESLFQLTIGDTGSGIDPENIQKIFDPFFTTKPPGKGTGLGLSITYSIINEHQGTINFISQKKRGTKAIIQLPLHRFRS